MKSKIDKKKFKEVTNKIASKYTDDILFIIGMLVFIFNSLWINVHFGMYTISIACVLSSFMIARVNANKKRRR